MCIMGLIARLLQMSYELLETLDSSFEIVMTGPDTNPATMATALTAYQATLFVGTGSGAIFGPVNTTYTELNQIIVRLGALIPWLHTLHTLVPQCMACKSRCPCKHCCKMAAVRQQSCMWHLH